MHRFRYMIYLNILFLAAAVTCVLQHLSHRSNYPLPTEAEQLQMRYEDSVKFSDLKREADYIIPN